MMYLLARTVFAGVLLGGALLVPGVSCGETALAMGVFGPLLRSVDGIAGDRAHRRAHTLALLPLLAGVLLGLPLFGKLLALLTGRYPLPMRCALLGLLPGMALGLIRRLSPAAFRRPACILTGLAAMALPPLFSLVFSQGAFPAGLPLLLTGALLCLGVALAAGTAVLPGVSGPLILLSLGVYERTLTALADLDLLLLLPMAAGVFAGLLFLTGPMQRLLRLAPAGAYAGAAGLTAGYAVALSLRTAALAGPAAPHTLIFGALAFLVCLLCGFARQRRRRSRALCTKEEVCS